MTTPIIQTLTDELLGEIELSEKCDCGFELDRADVAAIAGLIRTLRAENAELRKDAGRYRWLRDGESEKFISWYACGLSENSFDSEIDTAMEQEK
jgi:hypothetical protein